MVDLSSRRLGSILTGSTNGLGATSSSPVTATLSPATPAPAADTLTADGAPVLPRTHSAIFEITSPTSIYDALRASPTTRAVLLGAGGLASLAGTVTTAHAAETQVGVAQQGPKSIIYVGMNAEATHEVENLRGRVGQAGVTFIQPSKVQGQVTHAGKTYDINTAEGRVGFGRALGMPQDKAEALAKILENTDENARDEAAQLARVFREADRGVRTLERIVLSGHSVGSGVWGDGNGYLHLTTIGELALLFPHAAGQVQDLMMAACYSGGESKMETYTAIFPNLRSVWAYDGSAPGAVSGAVPHITRWEKGTRGNSGDLLSRNVATGTRKGENVAVWTVTKGYDNGQVRGPIENDRASYDTSRSIVPGFVSGETAVENSQTGPLRDHYNAIQRLLSRADLPAADRPGLEQERDLVIRLLYWKNVGTMFQQTYSTDIAQAFGEAGLPAPNFSQLSRKDALTKVTELEAKIEANPSTSARTKAFATRLHRALVDLATSAVPAAWL